MLINVYFYETKKVYMDKKSYLLVVLFSINRAFDRNTTEQLICVAFNTVFFFLNKNMFFKSLPSVLYFGYHDVLDIRNGHLSEENMNYKVTIIEKMCQKKILKFLGFPI